MKKLKYFIVPIIILILICEYFFYKSLYGYDFNIHMFSFGASDASLIKYKDSVILIDTSLEEYGFELVDYLEKNKIESIDYLILTHFDKDHIGGASRLLKNIEVKNIIKPEVVEEKQYYDILTNSIKDNTNVKLLNKRETIYIDDLIIDLYPASKVYDKSASNNSSIVTNIIYKDSSFLFAGDIEKERIDDFVKSSCTTSNFIKIPHHGRINKSSEKLIKCISPTYAVITSSDYEEESEELLNILDSYDVETYLTKNGSVDVKSDGKNIKILTKNVK